MPMTYLPKTNRIQVLVYSFRFIRSGKKQTGSESNEFADDRSDVVGGPTAQPDCRVDRGAIRRVSKRQKLQRSVAERFHQTRYRDYRTTAVSPNPLHTGRRPACSRARQSSTHRVDQDDFVGERARERRRDRCTGATWSSHVTLIISRCTHKHRQQLCIKSYQFS